MKPNTEQTLCDFPESVDMLWRIITHVSEKHVASFFMMVKQMEAADSGEN
jgi:hypothetical protein